MFTPTQRTLPILALLMIGLGLDARPAQAQTYTTPQVQYLLNIRLMQANALNGIIQQLSGNPTAQVPNSSVQSTIALYQGALSTVQYQINQLQLLNGAINQAYAVNALMQNPQYQSNIATLQYALATIQAQISNLQSTIVIP